MTEKATTSDYVGRGEEGKVLVETVTLEIDGEEKDHEIVSANRGFINEIENMDPETLQSEGIERMLEKYRTPDFRNEEGEVPSETIDRIPFPLVKTLMDGVLIASGIDPERARDENPFGDNESGETKNPAEMSKKERAQTMR